MIHTKQFKTGDTVRLLQDITSYGRKQVAHGCLGTVLEFHQVREESKGNRSHYDVTFGRRIATVLPEEIELVVPMAAAADRCETDQQKRHLANEVYHAAREVLAYPDDATRRDDLRDALNNYEAATATKVATL